MTAQYEFNSWNTVNTGLLGSKWLHNMYLIVGILPAFEKQIELDSTEVHNLDWIRLQWISMRLPESLPVDNNAFADGEKNGNDTNWFQKRDIKVLCRARPWQWHKQTIMGRGGVNVGGESRSWNQSSPILGPNPWSNDTGTDQICEARWGPNPWSNDTGSV